VPHPEQPSYEQLAARVAELLALVAQQGSLIESLQAEVAALRRTAGRDSSNSSQPPSQDGPAAKAKAGKREARRARPGRSQGGQKGHPGTGLKRVAVPFGLDDCLGAGYSAAAGSLIVKQHGRRRVGLLQLKGSWTWIQQSSRR
jgi:transposase